MRSLHEWNWASRGTLLLGCCGRAHCDPHANGRSGIYNVHIHFQNKRVSAYRGEGASPCNCTWVVVLCNEIWPKLDTSQPCHVPFITKQKQSSKINIENHILEKDTMSTPQSMAYFEMTHVGRENFIMENICSYFGRHCSVSIFFSASCTQCFSLCFFVVFFLPKW